MIIREATAQDLPRLLEMAERFHASTIYAGLVAWNPEPVERLIRQVIEHDNGVVFVAVGIGRLVGMIGLVVLPHPMSGELYAEELAWWVEPEHRQGSVGPRLLKTGIVWSGQKMARVLKLVAPAGSNVGGYYRRLGLVEVETVYQLSLPP